MEKRYQVFVSSTYKDLIEERQKINFTLLAMDCIPAGMELFPAADEEQWEFIKKIINDCDYYIIVIAGRYGTLTPDGISYTEKEFDYAVSIGLKVIAFVHQDSAQLSGPNGETDELIKLKLQSFIEKVTTNRIVKFWKNADELSGSVALALQRTIKISPGTGWVRANLVSNEKLLSELNDLRKENDELKSKVQKLDENKYKVKDVAKLDETIIINGTHSEVGYLATPNWSVEISWRKLFGIISPWLDQQPNQDLVRLKLQAELYKLSKKTGYSAKIDEHDFQTISIQFRVLGLITIQYLKTVKGSMAWFWALTSAGENLMLEERTVKTKQPIS
jgi:hypothetical protein